jgi:rhamnosyltransferase
MATYNGSQYIRQQLDSLISQTYSSWDLLIRDDGSKDDTIAIINEYIARNKNISLVINNTRIKGACPNFSTLFDLAVNNAKVKYIMFCDQDDIWKPDKIEKSVKEILAMENLYPQEPVLVYGDFELMQGDGSFMPGAFKLKHQVQLNYLLSFNFVYGCTTILNRPLMDKIGEIPNDAMNHDYWIALVASIYQSKYMGDKLLQYRQHQQNASGNVAGNRGFVQRLQRNLLAPGKEVEGLKIRLRMFAGFYDKYQNQLTAHNRQILTDYLQAFNKNRLQVCYVMLKDGITRNGLLQTVASYIQVLFFFSRVGGKKMS